MPRSAGHLRLRARDCATLFFILDPNALMQNPEPATLVPGEFIDSDHPAIVKFTNEHAGAGTPTERAIRLYYAVRDQVRYDPYSFSLERDSLKASTTLINGKGYCVPKAALLAACARANGIAAQIGLADVCNHMASARLLKLMGTNVFYYHGYTELWLDGAWRKATPAFNIELCERFGVKPLDFNGRDDSLMHEFDQSGHKHMEYLADHGSRLDVPYEELSQAYKKYYPRMLEQLTSLSGDMAAEIQAEQATNKQP